PTSTLVPYTTLFRSEHDRREHEERPVAPQVERPDDRPGHRRALQERDLTAADEGQPEHHGVEEVRERERGDRGPHPAQLADGEREGGGDTGGDESPDQRGGDPRPVVALPELQHGERADRRERSLAQRDLPGEAGDQRDRQEDRRQGHGPGDVEEPDVVAAGHEDGSDDEQE